MLLLTKNWLLKILFWWYTPKNDSLTSIHVKYYTPALIWSLVILVLSAKAGINLPESIFDLIALDKLGHFAVYAVLSGAVLWGNHKNELPLNRNTVITAVLLSSIYGIVMELMQYCFFPGRYFEYLDIIANIIGAISGFALYKYMYIKFT